MSGIQTKEYFRQYYLKNKNRILQRNKIKYKLDRNSPDKLLQKRKTSTKRSRLYRQRHPERVKIAAKKMYDSRKYRALLMVSKNGKVECNRCGCDEIMFLEINHINGGGCKEHRENGKIAIMDRLLSGKRKIDGLEIACRICNAWDYLGRKNFEQSKHFNILWK